MIGSIACHAIGKARCALHGLRTHLGSTFPPFSSLIFARRNTALLKVRVSANISVFLVAAVRPHRLRLPLPRSPCLSK